MLRPFSRRLAAAAGLMWLSLVSAVAGPLEVQKVTEGVYALVGDVVTLDNSLVQRIEIDRHTGRFTPIQ